MNSARLGLKSAVVATVGNDGFGEYIIEKLNGEGVITDFIKKLDDKPSSVIFISRTDGTPDFLPFRKADYWITEDQISRETLLKTNIYHTTCFALSKDPAQSAILKKAEEAYNLGCKLSIDVNYAEKLWKSKENALSVLKSYCKFNPLVKISEDDMLRLFEKKLKHNEIFDFFHSEGVETVCLTLGSNGVKLSQTGKEIIELPAIKIDKIMDATGAGDAFWSGFLFAYIQDKTQEDCLKVGLQLAALKLQNVGRLPDNIKILSELL
jgi:fructokinase